MRLSDQRSNGLTCTRPVRNKPFVVKNWPGRLEARRALRDVNLQAPQSTGRLLKVERRKALSEAALTRVLCREWRLIEVDSTLAKTERHRPRLLQLLARPFPASHFPLMHGHGETKRVLPCCPGVCDPSCVVPHSCKCSIVKQQHRHQL